MENSLSLKTIYDRALARSTNCDIGEIYCYISSCDAIYVGALSPVDVLLTDERGRQTGNTDSGIVVDIPNSLYSGPDTEEEFIVVYSPVPGTWDLQVTGTETGVYDLLFMHYSRNTTRIEGSFRSKVVITPGEEDVYQLEVPPYYVQLPIALKSFDGSYPVPTSRLGATAR